MTIIEQLTEYCDCLIRNPDIEGETYTEFTERDVYELIHLISAYTCWSQKPCETFLMEERREVRDLPDCADECFIYEFEPFYAPFDKDSFTFTLIEQNGLTETATPITSYIYSEADEKFRLELPLPSCKCRPKCGCQSKFKLIVTYAAGYEELPECLLPLFCEALQWIIEKNRCECEACQECENKYSELHEIDTTRLDGLLKEHFNKVLAAQYVRQLGLISLCYRMSGLWGVVV